jgi:hypothetical protein
MKRESFLEVKPELYSSKPNLYQIFSKKYGLYTKKDAELICEFLRNHMYKIITYEIINIKIED